MQRHLFMAYSCNYNPMCLPMRDKVKDSLVFDMDRKSIYAQNEEFGYIANVSSSVQVRNAANNNTSTIILTVQDGVALLSEYIPITFNTFSIIYNCDNGTVLDRSRNTVVSGSTVNLQAISYSFNGTGPVTNISIHNTNTSTYLCNSTNLNISTQQNYQLPVTNKYKANNYNSTYTFIGYAKDDKMDEYVTVSAKLYWKNHIIVGNIHGDTTSNTCEDIKNLIINNSNLGQQILSGNASTYVTNYYKNILSDNYKCETSASNPINCNNGKGTYLFFAIPSDLATINNLPTYITGVLGGASVQEFNSPVTVSYTNSANFIQNYNIYIATGQNWTGSTFYIN